MDVQIIMVLRTNAINVDSVAEGIHKQVAQLLMTLNGIAPNKSKLNDILRFEAVEIRPGSQVTKFFTFPTDLDTIKPKSNEITDGK